MVQLRHAMVDAVIERYRAVSSRGRFIQRHRDIMEGEILVDAWAASATIWPVDAFYRSLFRDDCRI